MIWQNAKEVRTVIGAKPLVASVLVEYSYAHEAIREDPNKVGIRKDGPENLEAIEKRAAETFYRYSHC